MTYIYLSKEIPLAEDQEEKAVETAKEHFRVLYSELMQHLPILETEASKLSPDWFLENSGFDPEMVSCEDWYEGSWFANYMFEISVKSPDGDPDCDFEIGAWEEWRKLGKPMYKDVFEPLQKCNWKGFKRDDVSVEFSAIKVVDSYGGEGIHVYNNQGWL